MKKIFLLLALFLTRLTCAGQPSALERLQAKVPVEPIALLTFSHLAGKYSDPTKEFAPGLSGSDLYLFPDGTYVYDEWADIHPLTIHDKGRWRIEDGIIVLRSDKDITWNPGTDRKYVAVFRRSHPGEVLLMGISDTLARFEESAGGQPETELMILAKERSIVIKSQKSGDKIRKKLMHTAWDPAYFRDAGK